MGEITNEHFIWSIKNGDLEAISKYIEAVIVKLLFCKLCPKLIFYFSNY